MMSYNVLITGASGEFGKRISFQLLEKGHTVIASMREVSGKNSDIAKKLEKAGAYIIEIDVSSDDSVNQGITKAIKITNCIDVVINNAGIGAFGFQESFTTKDWQKIFNVNLFGVQRVNRAILTHMRLQNSGLIVHISSLIGRMIFPYWGPYSASKWALEALAENYRVELLQLGIESCIIEPGPYPTTFFDTLMKPSDTQRVQSYGELSQMSIEFSNKFEEALASNKAQNPQNVADAISLLIDKDIGKRPFRTVVDKMGIGEYITDYNKLQEDITSNVYRSFCIEDMLNIKKV